MRLLKIALFSDSALPVLNGVSISIDALVRSLRERGHSVYVYTSGMGVQDADPNTTRFISFHTPLTKDYPLAIPPFYPWFHEFKRHNFDIVHTHTPFTVGFVGLRWAQSCDIPLVSTYHTHYDKYAHYVPIAPKRYLRYKIAKHTNFYYNSVDHVVTPSEASRRWLLRHSVHKPVSVIPTGVPDPIPIDRNAVRASLGLSPLRKVVLYAGRIAKEKNIGTLLEAASLVFSQDVESELWIVGDGPARSDFQSLARQLEIGDRVRFWGAVDRQRIGEFYAASDVFAFPSMTETQGLVVTEAMTYGLPAIVVHGGGASASVKDGQTGFVVHNDPFEMSQRIIQTLSDPLLYESLSRAAETHARSCTISEMTSRILATYRSVLGETEAQLVHV
ncbi:MAG: glycosyltransferase [Armatimonadetes bacterium]|nr:glycosyltransferase [Armatimonadota bacterium]